MPFIIGGGGGGGDGVSEERVRELIQIGVDDNTLDNQTWPVDSPIPLLVTPEGPHVIGNATGGGDVLHILTVPTDLPDGRYSIVFEARMNTAIGATFFGMALNAGETVADYVDGTTPIMTLSQLVDDVLTFELRIGKRGSITRARLGLTGFWGGVEVVQAYTPLTAADAGKNIAIGSGGTGATISNFRITWDEY
ncbi:hypothetical protein [Pseudovibrio sp. SPO723]|uniref:hypothetical protein n=1 Tax=Nesiotobacter zosterae TaxID=392721 RepID=UPI0029C497A7|nr:hypothetical protein [Pseudovibrio sp. SPO723]MDX5592557.1 hypothetical protein [Pseudovibrio sp. SPO723]